VDVGHEHGIFADHAIVVDDDGAESLQVGRLLAEYPGGAVVGQEFDAGGDGDVIADPDQPGLGPERVGNNRAVSPTQAPSLRKYSALVKRPYL